jgi:hypothetical protein
MKNRDQSIYSRFFAACVAVVMGLLLLASGAPLFAQSSVEKSETSQQAREPEHELERAKAAVTKPNEPKPTPPETGRMWGLYSTTTSIEIGYRFVDTDGSRSRYLSDVNVRDGLRLLDYSLDMRARPGTAILFDFLRLDMTNAGGDQSQYFSLRADKTRAYRFDATVRRFNYYRSLATFIAPIANTSWRDHDLRQQIGDFNLKLFPQRSVRINLGYGRSQAKGRSTPTYSYERDLFQLLGDTRWEANDYRLGLDASYRQWDFNVEQFYRRFKNDTEIGSKPGVDPGANLSSPTFGAISFLERDAPLRSRALVTRASVRGSISDRLHILLRGMHNDERMKTPYAETSTGTSSNNSNILSRALTAGGVVKRPSSVLDAGITFDFNKHVAVSNTFRYINFRIEGDVSTLQTSLLQPPTGAQQTVIAQTIGTRLTDLTSLLNTLELNLSFGKKFSANLGWRATQRDVTLRGQFATPTSAPSATNPLVKDEEESETTHAFVGGMRIRPTNRTSFIFDVERGTNNNVFVRISPLEYTRFRMRAQVQATNSLSFTGAFTSTDRTNPTRQVENETDFRSYTVSVNWEPVARLWLDVGYDYHDLFSTANIRYFLTGSQERLGKSLYYGRMNSVFANTRLGLTKRLDLLMAYYYIMDRGAPAVTIGPNDFVTALPLRRHNPEVRLAYRFSNNVTGNISYRHYSYNEREFAAQDYRSNILMSSVRFTF